MSKAAKIAFRKDMKKLLAQVSQSTIQAESVFVTEKLLQNQDYQSARSVSVFLNMPEGEINTLDIIKDIFKAGKKAFVPMCGKDTMKMVLLKSMEDYDSLVPNSWGIKEPRPEEGRQDCLDLDEGLDLIIMPALAFDKQGNRIGYGKGYYDKFLEQVYIQALNRHQPKPKTIAIGLSAQLVDSVPTEGTDIKPDLIIIQHGKN